MPFAAASSTEARRSPAHDDRRDDRHRRPPCGEIERLRKNRVGGVAVEAAEEKIVRAPARRASSASWRERQLPAPTIFLFAEASQRRGEVVARRCRCGRRRPWCGRRCACRCGSSAATPRAAAIGTSVSAARCSVGRVVRVGAVMISEATSPPASASASRGAKRRRLVGRRRHQAEAATDVSGIRHDLDIRLPADAARMPVRRHVAPRQASLPGPHQAKYS